LAEVCERQQDAIDKLHKRLRLVESTICDRELGREENQRTEIDKYNEFKAALAAQGIDVVDLLQRSKEYKHDPARKVCDGGSDLDDRGGDDRRRAILS
jgi:hypothetical protein